MKYDIVIVGSGLGGLISGFILGKNGYKVCILEKNTQLGGCLQSFKRDGVIFDTGMHYIGSMDANQILNRFFNYFSLLNNVGLRKLDVDGFDVISIQDKQYKFAMGYGLFEDTLCNYFPNEYQNIHTYTERIRKIASESPLYNLQEITQNVLLNTESVKTSVNDFVESITKNSILQNVLVGNLPLYAGVRNKTPLYIHALINNFYIQSAYRIVGGGVHIAKSLSDSIKGFGGDIFIQSEVVKFNCDNEKMVSVTLQNGNIIEGKSFISNIHPQSTIDKLETPFIRKAYRDRIGKLENTISNFTVYIVFKKDTVRYMNHNYFHYNTNDIWECANYTQNNWPLNYLYMHQAPESNSEFADGGLLISYMNFKDVSKWENTRIGNRGQDYKDFKDKRAQLLLDSLSGSFPGIRNNIKSYTCSSPLTYRDYTATKEGSMYGVLRDKEFPSQTLVSQRTRIPNFFMTGQNTNSHGILGVIIGAIITCSEFLDINSIIQDINR